MIEIAGGIILGFLGLGVLGMLLCAGGGGSPSPLTATQRARRDAQWDREHQARMAVAKAEALAEQRALVKRYRTDLTEAEQEQRVQEHMKAEGWDRI